MLGLSRVSCFRSRALQRRAPSSGGGNLRFRLASVNLFSRVRHRRLLLADENGKAGRTLLSPAPPSVPSFREAAIYVMAGSIVNFFFSAELAA